MFKRIIENSSPVGMELKNVSYAYEGEDAWVWKDISCQFYQGKIHAITGESGCGKSSLLYMLNGMIPHMMEGKMEGTIWIDEEDVTAQPPCMRCEKIGLIMQNPESQFCTFTVEEELAFGMENLCLTKDVMKKRIQETLSYVGMAGYEQCDLNRLSGGQKQKVAIASILVMDTDILLLDEPTANLDPRSRKEIFSLIVQLAREKKKTIVLVEHNLEEISSEVDYLFALKKEHKMIPADTYWKIHSGENCHDHVLPTKKQGHVFGRENGPVVLELSNLKFSYESNGNKQTNKKMILNGLNLSIYERDFLAIVGGNGVGKSTLLRVIFQTNKQNAGTICLYGKPVEQYKKKVLYEQMGLVFQNPENQFVTNTVLDELMFSLNNKHASQEEKERKVTKVLQQFHLEKEQEKSPFILSQGQKRRLSVATMLLTEQKILFLDEPTYGQDFENRHELMRDMYALNKTGTTIVMITHDLSLVKEYAQRVIELRDGTVSFDGDTETYFHWLIRQEGI